MVDQVDADAQVLFGEHVPFEVLLERGRLVVNESAWVERVGDKLGVERDVGQVVLVLDFADELGQVRARVSGVTTHCKEKRDEIKDHGRI